MLLSQMAAEAAKDYKYDIILANVNGKLTEISDMDITDEKVEYKFFIVELFQRIFG